MRINNQEGYNFGKYDYDYEEDADKANRWYNRAGRAITNISRKVRGGVSLGTLILCVPLFKEKK